MLAQVVKCKHDGRVDSTTSSSVGHTVRQRVYDFIEMAEVQVDIDAPTPSASDIAEITL